MSAPIVAPGQKVRITVPIYSNSSVVAKVKAEISIFQGGWQFWAGPLVDKYETIGQNINPGTYVNFWAIHTAKLIEYIGAPDERDIGIKAFLFDSSNNSWSEVASGFFQDRFYVRKVSDVYKFIVGEPSVVIQP